MYIVLFFARTVGTFPFSQGIMHTYTKYSCTIILSVDGTNMDGEKLRQLIKKHVKSREAFERLCNVMRLQTPPLNMPLSASIDLWLAICPCSWRELAWSFYQCQLPAAVIEIKEIITEGLVLWNTKLHVYLILHIFLYLDHSFTLENIFNTLPEMKVLLSLLPGQVNKRTLENWIKLHPCSSWSLLASVLLKANKKDDAKSILQNFHIKGCVFCSKTSDCVHYMYMYVLEFVFYA